MDSLLSSEKPTELVISWHELQNVCLFLQIHLDPVLCHSHICLPHEFPPGNQGIHKTSATSIEIYS